jgi:alanine-glyoxylate transaminase/serine-glyoxylate transaminase/serine-pyruvate transaminase
VTELQVPAGQTFSFDALKQAVENQKPKVLFLVQGESSTGTHQSLAGLSELCKKNGTMLVVDTVCTLGGVPMFADKWGVDAIYSGTQKCLSGPPGARPRRPSHGPPSAAAGGSPLGR